MGMILPPTAITTAVAGAVGQVVQLRGGPGSGQVPNNLAFQWTFTYGSGGTTVNAWLQTSLDGGGTWCDVASPAQFATTSARVAGSVISAISFAQTAATDGTLAAGTLNNGLFGPLWRVKYTSVGTYAGTTLRLDGYSDGIVLAPVSGG